MKGTVIQFRRGKTNQIVRHFILDVGAKNRKEASSFIGKSVEWRSSGGKLIRGKITGAHGNKGLVRAVFEKGLPGQALNESIEVK